MPLERLGIFLWPVAILREWRSKGRLRLTPLSVLRESGRTSPEIELPVKKKERRSVQYSHTQQF